MAARIISRYVFKQLWAPFAINLFFFTFVFLMTQLLQLTDLIVNHQLGLTLVGRMVVYTMPFFLQFIIPMSVMMAILLILMRMSSDNEILAMKAAGISVVRLLPPIFSFALIACLATALVAIWGLPQGRMAARRLIYQVASSSLDAAIKPRVFIDNFDKVVLYINQVAPGSDVLKDIFIEDRRHGDVVTTVVAPRGILVTDPRDRAIVLRLFDGQIHQVDMEQQMATAVSFHTYDVRLDLKNHLRDPSKGPKDEEEMSLAELRSYLRNTTKKDAQYYLTLMEWHKKFALPSACLALALIATALGIQTRRSKPSHAIGLGLGFFLLYYLMLSAGWVFGEAGVYPPLIGMWLPNAVSAGLGIALLSRKVREKPLPSFGGRLKVRELLRFIGRPGKSGDRGRGC